MQLPPYVIVEKCVDYLHWLYFGLALSRWSKIRRVNRYRVSF